LAIFRLFEHLKVLLIFLSNKYFFLEMDFLSVKSTFRLLKRNPKQALKMTKKHFWQKLKNEALA
jgi:hypothetical protein